MSETRAKEVWAFAGVRANGAGKAVHVWFDAEGTGEELWYAAKGTHAVGSLYLMDVGRDGDRTTRYGSPVYDGGRVDAELASRWQAEHYAAETRLASDRLERNARRTAELDELIGPLRERVRGVKSYRDRAALVAYITTRLLS